jgi:hypothetical protein
MDIPELSLEATVGAKLGWASATHSVKDAESTNSGMVFATFQFNNPWDIFTSTVAARYYF